jgi:vancomycin resistance protein YoaR
VRWIAAATVVLAVLGAVAVGGFQVAYAGRVFPGVQALGVDLGGRTPDEAQAALRARADALLAAPVTIVAGDTSRRTTWRDVGLRLDSQALLDDALAVGRDGSPVRRLTEQWQAARGSHSLDLTTRTDDPALKAFLDEVAAGVDRPPRDARLLVQPDGQIQYTSSEPGRALDSSGATAALADGALRGAAEVTLPVRETPPQTPDELRREARDFAERVLASPLVLTDGERKWTVDQRELASWLEFEGGAGQRLAARVDADAVRRRVAALGKEIDRPVANARLDWNGGRPRVIRAAAAGRALDAAAAQAAILERVTTADHTVALPVKEVRPAVDGENLTALGLQELIEESTTSFAGSVPEKAHNIRLAAERLHGAVVPPGALFSFNREVGPTTLASGYQWGFGITGGAEGLRTVPSVAGGICQVATTLFQAFFWSGYRLEERHWHLYWIPAYTSRGVVGLDATVDEDSDLDLQFVNTTSQAVLIQASASGDSVTFRLYGTKPSWTVDVAAPEITNRVPPDPRPIVEDDPTLAAGRRVAVETAREGFDVAIARTVTSADDVRTLRLKSVYRPSRNVTLVGTGGAAGSAPSTAQNRSVSDRSSE